MTKKLRAFVLKMRLEELKMGRLLSFFSLCSLCLCGLLINLRHRNAQGLSLKSLPQPLAQASLVQGKLSRMQNENI